MRDLSSGDYEVLEVVQYKEHLAIADQPGQANHVVIGSGTFDAECRRNGRNQQLASTDRCERHIDDAVPELSGYRVCKFDCQASLPDSAGTGHRHEPDISRHDTH